MRITVFCGSAEGNQGVYVETAKDLGRELALHNVDLVYGGTRCGLMGAVADEVLAYGGHAYGIIHRVTERRGLAHRGLTGLEVVDSIYQYKTRMAEMADAFIAIPGGTGTLDELIEVWNHAILGIHTKPLALLNVCGYFDKLLAFLDEMVRSEFAAVSSRQLLRVEQSPARLVAELSSMAPRTPAATSQVLGVSDGSSPGERGRGWAQTGVAPPFADE